MIELKDVYKSFDGHKVLKGISATFDSGKANLVIGRSGSGKTVLLKSLIGLYQADSGEICFDGRNLLALKERQKRKLRKEIGMLFQGSALFDFMPVLQNVMFPLEMFSNLTAIEIEERAKRCLDRVNLDETSYKLYPSEISGGMQKRAAIARAIVLNPKYLFCDEPNSGLDPFTSLVIDRLIKEITEEFNITTVINTHDMNSVMEIGDNIIFIKDGIKEWTGTRFQIFESGNEALESFVFASTLFRKIKQAHKLLDEQKQD